MTLSLPYYDCFPELIDKCKFYSCAPWRDDEQGVNEEKQVNFAWAYFKNPKVSYERR